MSDQSDTGNLLADPELRQRVDGRLARRARRVANPVSMGYEYSGSHSEAVVAAFAEMIVEWPLTRMRFRLTGAQDLAVDTTDAVVGVAEFDLGQAPRWLAEHVFWCALRSDFDLLEGPLGFGLVVRWQQGVFLGIAAEHSVADGRDAEDLFSRLQDALAPLLGPGRLTQQRRRRASVDRVVRTGRTRDAASANLPVDVPASELVRSLTTTVDFCRPGDHRSRLSRTLSVPRPEIDQAATLLGVTQFTLVLAAYALALLELSARSEIYVVTPISTRLLRGQYRFGVARMVPLRLRAPTGHLDAWFRGIQHQIGTALVTDVSLSRVLAQAEQTNRVPWAFLGWETVVVDLEGFRLWEPSDRQEVVVRPGVGLSAVSGSDETRLTLRLQQTPRNEEVIDTLVEVLRKTVRDVLAAGAASQPSHPATGNIDEDWG